MGKRKQSRISMTAQLVEGQDDDLIAWLGKLPAGTRQQTIKNALRYALDYPIPAPSGNGMSPEVLERISELERQIANIGMLPNSVITAQDPIEAAPQMSRDEQGQRASKLKKSTW